MGRKRLAPSYRSAADACLVRGDAVALHRYARADARQVQHKDYEDLWQSHSQIPGVVYLSPKLGPAMGNARQC